MARLGICHNPILIGKYELAGRALTEGSDILSLTLIVFSAFIPTPTQTPALTLNLPDMYMNVNLQKATKLALELFVTS